jgi:ferric hydroxamate transport system ATP-binding protein
MYHLSNIQITRAGRSILQIDDLKLQPDEVTVIIGHNGSGKSTLMKLLAGQLKPDQGKVQLNGELLDRYSSRQLARQIAFMPQQLPDAANLQVQELVLLGRYAWRGWLQRWQSEDYAFCKQAMQATEVAHLSEQMLSDLSGGERQRAWIAMLLAQQAPLLLLDEPNAALDLAHQYSLMALLTQLNRREQRGVLIILHDFNLAIRHADRIIALRQGKLWFDGTPAALLAHPQLSELYGIALEIIPRGAGKHPVAVVA